MTYEEIKKKYEAQARKRKTAIGLAEAKIEALKALRQNCIETRELYRQKADGTISHERVKNWDRLSLQISRIDTKIRAAEIELARVSMGDEALEDLTKRLGL